jgi:cytidylate kinase
MGREKLTIAIDGHSSCGKSTFARHLAKRLQLTYIDTGAMYRALTLKAIRTGALQEGEIWHDILRDILKKIEIEFRQDDVTGENLTYLNGENVEEEIRDLEVSSGVSIISSVKEVRDRMVELQRKMAESYKVVLEGRDIGTVVFPDADLKIFLTASIDVRTQRRYDEMLAKGIEITKEQVRANIEERDQIDSTRAVSPLKKAEDAIVLDNSDMTIGEEIEWAIEQINKLG